MKITEHETIMLGIDLPSPFNLAFGSLHSLPRIIYRLKSDEGTEGIGEASIDFPFCDYDMWDVYNYLEQLNIEGLQITDSTEFLDSQNSTEKAGLCALNMALDDLQGKLKGLSVGDLYGIKRNSGQIVESMPFYKTMDDFDADVERILKLGRLPKIKLGQKGHYDEWIVNLFTWGFKNSKFSVDFNASYNLNETISLLDKFTNRALENLVFLEQPTRKELGIPALVTIKQYLQSRNLELAVVADESFVTEQDAIDCAENNISLNMKIQKIGGIHAGKKIEQIIKPSTKLYQTQVGGTFPTAIGRVYDQHGASTFKYSTLPSDAWQPSTDWFTGSKHLIEEKFETSNGISRPLQTKGLGITPNWVKIRQFQVRNPKEEYTKIRNGESGEKIKVELTGNKTYTEIYEEKTGRKSDWNLK